MYHQGQASPGRFGKTPVQDKKLGGICEAGFVPRLRGLDFSLGEKEACVVVF